MFAWPVLSEAADRFPVNTPVAPRVSLGLFASGVGLLPLELAVGQLWV